MPNITKKSRNNICPCCGSDFQSYNLGSSIVKVAKEIRKKDEQADVLIAQIPLTKGNHKPENFAFYKFNFPN